MVFGPQQLKSVPVIKDALHHGAKDTVTIKLKRLGHYSQKLDHVSNNTRDNSVS